VAHRVLLVDWLLFAINVAPADTRRMTNRGGFCEVSVFGEDRYRIDGRS